MSENIEQRLLRLCVRHWRDAHPDNPPRPFQSENHRAGTVNGLILAFALVAGITRTEATDRVREAAND